MLVARRVVEWRLPATSRMSVGIQRAARGGTDRLSHLEIPGHTAIPVGFMVAANFGKFKAQCTER